MQRRQFLAAAVGSAAASIAPPPPSTAQANRWPPDGVGAFARFGVLTLDFDPVPESELWAMVPRGVSVHAAPVPRGAGPGAGFVEPPGIDEAVDRLVPSAPRTILLGYTSSSYALGTEADARVRAHLEDRAKGTRVIFPCLAATAALGELGVQRIVVVHPPWWTETANEQGRATGAPPVSTSFNVCGWNPCADSQRLPRAKSSNSSARGRLAALKPCSSEGTGCAPSAP